MFRIALPLAGILTFEGIETNSTGDVSYEGLSSFAFGPEITAVCFANVKSISMSDEPLFLNGILNFYPYWPFLTQRGITFSFNSGMKSSF